MRLPLYAFTRPQLARPCSVLRGLCFRREGYGQDGAACASLPAHQGELGFAAVTGCSAPRARPQGTRDPRPRGCDPSLPLPSPPGPARAGNPTPGTRAPGTLSLRPDLLGLELASPPPYARSPRSRGPRPAPRPRGLGTPLPGTRAPGAPAPPLTNFSPQLGRYSALFLGMAYGAKRYSE